MDNKKIMDKTTFLKLLKRLLTGDKAALHDEIHCRKIPAVLVYCIHCRQHIFYLRDEKKPITPANLAPLAGRPPPTNLDCPSCNRTCVAYSPAPTCKTNKGYIS